MTTHEPRKSDGESGNPTLDEDDAYGRSYTRLEVRHSSLFLTPSCALVVSDIMEESSQKVGRFYVDAHRSSPKLICK